jgi:hypothetical protein
MQDVGNDVVSINLPLVHTPHRGVSAAFESAHHVSSLPVPDGRLKGIVVISLDQEKFGQ